HRGFFRIMLRTIGAALVLSTAMTIAACNAGPPVDPGTPRPIVRVSTTEEFVLSAFRNFPQFSVQLTDIGDSEKRLAAVQQGSVDVTVEIGRASCRERVEIRVVDVV